MVATDVVTFEHYEPRPRLSTRAHRVSWAAFGRPLREVTHGHGRAGSRCAEATRRTAAGREGRRDRHARQSPAADLRAPGARVPRGRPAAAGLDHPLFPAPVPDRRVAS